eukprot:4474839-Pleurochrysis_carterae.AAC.2
MLLSALEHAAFLVQRGDSCFESRQVIVAVIRPHVFERYVADPSLGAARARRVAAGRWMRFIVVTFACREESGMFSLVLCSELTCCKVFFVGERVRCGTDRRRVVRGSARSRRHAAHAQRRAAGAGGELD